MQKTSGSSRCSSERLEPDQQNRRIAESQESQPIQGIKWVRILGYLSANVCQKRIGRQKLLFFFPKCLPLILAILAIIAIDAQRGTNSICTSFLSRDGSLHVKEANLMPTGIDHDTLNSYR